MPRFIPLRLKERINRAAGRAVFDLTEYLRFEPSTLENMGVRVEYRPEVVDYIGERRRVALVTPHLGPGGAERVLLDMARSFDSKSFELLLIATHSRDSRWVGRWREHVDRIVDLGAEMGPKEVPSALFSLLVNQKTCILVLQNTLFGYVIAPKLHEKMPFLNVVDLVHTAGGRWDFARVTAPAASAIHRRVAISETVRERLIRSGTDPARIVVIPNGVDLARFRPAPGPGDGVFRILFAARLDPVKRPLLVVEIAAELRRIRPGRPFRIVVAGDGPLEGPLRRAIGRAKLQDVFDLRGFVEDAAPLMTECDALLLASSHEGMPLTILEAFASGRPAVAPAVGAIGEALDPSAGILVSDHDRPAAYANALAMLMDDPERRLRMGVAARRLAEQRYDRERSLETYRDLWRSCLEASAMR